VSDDGITRTIEDVIAGARANELLSVMHWLKSEARLAHARRSFIEANALRRAATRLENGMHHAGRNWNVRKDQ